MLTRLQDLGCLIVLGLMVGSVAVAEGTEKPSIETVLRHRVGKEATADFDFKDLERPSRDDAATAAKVSVISGSVDRNSPGVRCLNDGQLPQAEDQPSRNFFFGGPSNGGRILMDLGSATDIREVRTYSWHPNSRGAQVFTLFAAPEGDEVEFDLQWRSAPTQHGWTRVTEVDTRGVSDSVGGQYAALIRGKDASAIGKYRYLLFDVQPTGDGRNAATFFSEIDVDDGQAHQRPVPKSAFAVVEIDGGYTIRIDTTETPELSDWVKQELVPVCREWYPRIVEMLPSEGYEAPREFSIVFKSDMSGVAYASGTQITCAGSWYQRNLAGEAKGSIVHEMVHIVQQYRGRRGRTRNPGWMVEGLADYIRWFLFEPESNRPRVDPQRSNFDDGYRTSAAFLDYATRKYDPRLIERFNAKMRNGEYSESLWLEYTGKPPTAIWSEYLKTITSQ